MLIALHKNARTTTPVRAEIAASDETASVLAQRFGITDADGQPSNCNYPVKDQSRSHRPFKASATTESNQP